MQPVFEQGRRQPRQKLQSERMHLSRAHDDCFHAEKKEKIADKPHRLVRCQRTRIVDGLSAHGDPPAEPICAAKVVEHQNATNRLKIGSRIGVLLSHQVARQKSGQTAALLVPDNLVGEAWS